MDTRMEMTMKYEGATVLAYVYLVFVRGINECIMYLSDDAQKAETPKM